MVPQSFAMLTIDTDINRAEGLRWLKSRW